MVDVNASFHQHFFQIMVANPVFTIPTNSPDDYIIFEVTMFEQVHRGYIQKTGAKSDIILNSQNICNSTHKSALQINPKGCAANGTKRSVFETEIVKMKSWKRGAYTQVRAFRES